MKKRILNYNDLVRKYYRYIRRRHNLMLANKNHRRQAILTKHIERLHAKLTSLRLSIKKGSLVAGVMAGAITMNTNNSNAQSFATPVTNPFSLTNGYGGLGSPTFYDLDNDGDLDILYEGGGTDNYYHENTGTNSAPVFGAIQTNPFGMDNSFGSWRDVKLVDLDNDGDADLLMNADGDWQYQENTGTASSPAFGTAQTNPFGLSYAYYYAVADLIDLDNDGDLDLIAGTYYGLFLYFENTGTVSSPAFAAPVTNPFGLVDISPIGDDYNSPTFADIDQDGDYDILSGDVNGDFYYFENTGTAVAPAFAAPVTNPFGLTNVGGASGYYATPTFVDLDNDGDMDIMTKSYDTNDGDFIYFENVYSYAGIKEESSIENLAVYPNPSNSIVNIDFETTDDNVNVEIVSIDGKIIYQQANFNSQTAIDVSSWNAGTYTVKVMSNSSVEIIPLVVE